MSDWGDPRVQLRDHLAGLAMQGLLAGIDFKGANPVQVLMLPASISTLSYSFADAMLAERCKESKAP